MYDRGKTRISNYFRNIKNVITEYFLYNETGVFIYIYALSNRMFLIHTLIVMVQTKIIEIAKWLSQ